MMEKSKKRKTTIHLFMMNNYDEKLGCKFILDLPLCLYSCTLTIEQEVFVFYFITN
jgi:hypothetical protein